MKDEDGKWNHQKQCFRNAIHLAPNYFDSRWLSTPCKCESKWFLAVPNFRFYWFYRFYRFQIFSVLNYDCDFWDWLWWLDIIEINKCLSKVDDWSSVCFHWMTGSAWCLTILISVSLWRTLFMFAWLLVFVACPISITCIDSRDDDTLYFMITPTSTPTSTAHTWHHTTLPTGLWKSPPV